jgi:hypothetical protein
MPTVAEPKQIRRQLRQFDHVMAFLLALIVLVATAFVSLLSLWLANRVSSAHVPPRPMEIINLGAGDDEGMAGNSTEPGEMVLPTTDQQPLEATAVPFEETEISRDLTSVVEAANKLEIDFSDPAFPTPSVPKPTREGSPGGEGIKGSGTGKGGTGFGGEDGFGNVLPHESRWTIGYPRQNVDKYAAMLDYFGIKLGVVKGNETLILSQLSNPTPTSEKMTGIVDMLPFEWEGEGYRKSDADLLHARKIDFEGARIVQYFPRELEYELSQIEQRASKQPIEKILKTVFLIRPLGGDKYEFVVRDITYAP